MFVSLIGGCVVLILFYVSLCGLMVKDVRCLWYSSDYFILDYMGYIMIMLTCLLYIILLCLGVNRFYLFISVFSAILSYIVAHALFFWFFYELSVLRCLYMLFVYSPYRERYTASWYFGGYIICGSVPLLLCILAYGYYTGGWSLSSSVFRVEGGNFVLLLEFIFFLLFSMKVPLFPFHVWLPIVHAEARSPISVVLRGYVMKLGIVGLIRFCGGLWGSLYSCNFMFIYGLMGLVCLYSAYFELDSKRWLAMLRLCHITISIWIMVCSRSVDCFYGILYGLGHGLAAGRMFILIWWGYTICLSRSWLILCGSLGRTTVLQVLVSLVFFCVSGFPPTPQFFSEVVLMGDLLSQEHFTHVLLLCLYLFAASSVVLVTLGLIIGVLSGRLWNRFIKMDDKLYAFTYLSLVGILIYMFM